MSLARGAWSPASLHTVVAEFLQAERHKLVGLTPEQAKLMDQPDTADPIANHSRLRLLYRWRLLLMVEVPPDTEWLEVHSLTEDDFPNLLVIDRCSLVPAGVDNRLDRASLVLDKGPLKTPPSQWCRPILWGHSKDGPFTILEGNHRLLAYAGHSAGSGLSVPAFVGLSPTPCFWHRPDPAMMLGNDLIKR